MIDFYIFDKKEQQMKQLLAFICVFALLCSCKQETKQAQIPIDSKTTITEAPTIAEKIAKAHGIDHWKDVNRITFTFQVDRDDKKGDGRAWTWFPKKDSIIMKAGEQQVTYNRQRLDSVPSNADKAFINDKYWLLVPFQLVWDEGTTISEPTKVNAPISKTEMNKITLTYGHEGGYTPGDAYDIFFDNDYLIREWIFRKGNSPEPSMITTFENYKDFNGILIAKEHKNAEGNFNLYFSDLSIE